MPVESVQADGHSSPATAVVPALQVGDVWYRVEGSHIGEETYAGIELLWTSWQCVRLTPQGGWFACVESPFQRHKFALSVGARSISRTKRHALQRLVARKVRQVQILEGDLTVAKDTLQVARDALAVLGLTASLLQRHVAADEASGREGLSSAAG